MTLSAKGVLAGSRSTKLAAGRTKLKVEVTDTVTTIVHKEKGHDQEDGLGHDPAGAHLSPFGTGEPSLSRGLSTGGLAAERDGNRPRAQFLEGTSSHIHRTVADVRGRSLVFDSAAEQP
jgi:hypothetical protein